MGCRSRRIASFPKGSGEIALVLCAAALFGMASARLSAQDWPTSPVLDEVVAQAVDEGVTPGAVLVVGHRGRIVHRKAYGSRSLEPAKEPMTLDTIFDCASLTKVLATAPAVMQLVEQGKLRLSDRLTKHLPAFSSGKSEIRIRELLTHYSGLRPDVDLEPEWSGYETGIQKAYAEVPVAPVGSRFIYSDINYLLLAELVRKLTDMRIDEYARKHIFGPLEMSETSFKPAAGLKPRIAPTEQLPTGEILRGVVHDPTTRYMGGVAGHAGVFSTADDLARFARMMLDQGRLGEARILSPLSVIRMTTPQSPPGKAALRGLGWDIDSRYASVRGDLFPMGSYGHSGFTGTSVWIDPATDTFVILLTNRVHPTTKTSVVSLRSHVASAVAAGIDAVDENRLRREAFQRRSGDPSESGGSKATEVFTGLDVLARDGFKPFAGKRVGLITNQTGIDRNGRANIDLLVEAEGVRLSAVFSPEHGIDGVLDQAKIPDAEGSHGAPIYSLYQPGRRRPTAAMLDDVDVLVFDIQDVGARFYTYITTMAYAMEAAAEHGVPFYVLDRPNPITGVVVEGPVLDEELRSFIGYFPMPIRHGMTVGELARMFNQERAIGARLEVIEMEQWSRDQWFDETGLPWVNPSPNIRTLDQALLYPGIAMLEGLRDYSVGRGTDTPFEFVGADWIDGRLLAERLNRRQPGGVGFYAVERTPRSSKFAGVSISGVQIAIVDRKAVRATRLGLEIANTLRELYPDQVMLNEADRWIGDRSTREALANNQSTDAIYQRWQSATQTFLRQRQPYLLY